MLQAQHGFAGTRVKGTQLATVLAKHLFCQSDSGLQDHKSHPLASQKESVFLRHVDLLPGLMGLYSNLGCDTGAPKQAEERQWHSDFRFPHTVLDHTVII